MNQLYINARFLDRPLTGVERVAMEMLSVLAREHLDDRGRLTIGGRTIAVKLIAPRVTDGVASPFANLPLIREGFFQGHLWEQLDLPRLTFGQGLLSLCNTGPMFKRDHWLFLHDAQTFAIPHNFTPAFRLGYRLLFRLCGRNARAILVNSHFTRGELARLVGIKPEKMRVCALGSDHVNDGAAVPAAATLMPAEPFIVAFASSNPNKNFRAIEAALARLGAAAPLCVVIGARNQRVFKTADPAGGRVRRIGRVDDATLAALYARARCLVFPSHYEGFGLPVVEAMALGCPVVVADTGALPEVAGDAALYCDPERPETLARAIELIGAGPELRQRLRDAGRARARAFRWRDATTGLVDALRVGFRLEATATDNESPLTNRPLAARR